MRDFHGLAVWRKAHDLALGIHRATEGWPNAHLVLRDQLRRSAMSVPANIAEGCGRGSNRDFARFVQIAIASSTELENHIQFTLDAAIAAGPEWDSLRAANVEVRRMLCGLKSALSGQRSAVN